MRSLFALSFAGLLVLGSCTSPSKPLGVPSSLSPEAAKQRAQRDFASGNPKIYSAGGYVIIEPGITEAQKALVADLPRNGSLAGCTNPKGRYSIGFATAYNQEIVALLQHRHAY